MAVSAAAKKYHMSRFMLRSRILEEKGLKTRKKQGFMSLAASLEIARQIRLCQDTKILLTVDNLILSLERYGSVLAISLLKQSHFGR